MANGNSKLDSESLRQMKLIQASSGVFFSGFLLIHLLHQGTAVGGEHLYDGIMDVLRVGYKFPLVEVALLGSLAAHTISSVRIHVNRKDPVKRAPGWTWLDIHRLNGQILALLTIPHVLGTQLPLWVYGESMRFGAVASLFNYAPISLVSIQLALGVSGAYHLVYGLWQAARVLNNNNVQDLVDNIELGQEIYPTTTASNRTSLQNWVPTPGSKKFKIAIAGLSTVAVCGVLAFTGLFFNVKPSMRDYDKHIATFLKVLRLPKNGLQLFKK